MKPNRTILKKWKMHIYGLIVLIIVQCISLPLVEVFLREFIEHSLVRNIVLNIILMICTTIDLYFLINRIIILRYILNKTPIKCRLEDILFIGYRDDKQTRYAPFPIVRSLENNKLYLSYDKYSLVNFITVFNYSDKRNIQGMIYKSDGTPVQLGDMTDMYIHKIINIPISVNHSENIVKLKHKKIYFRHINSRFNIDVFKDITFFKGAICLEPENESYK